MARGRTNNSNNNSNNSLNRKIDALNSSINDLVDVLERISTNTKDTNSTRGNNPFIRPGSRKYKNQRDRDREFYYEWSQYYKAPKRNKKWVDMSDEEKQAYNKVKNKRKKEAQDYVRRSNEREELYRELRSSRFGSTAVGRYTQNVMERNQKIQDYGMMGKYMHANAEKLGKGLFGAGKAGTAAAKGIGFMGKAISGVSKLLGGPFVTAILFAVDALQAIGEQVGDWKKMTAEMYKHQTKQEQLQYELSKQRYVIENQMNIENVSAIGDKQLKMLDAQGSIMLEALKLSTEQYTKGIETSMGAMTKGINQSAYDAAAYSIDAASNYQKLLLHRGQRETEYGRYVELRNLQQQGKIAGLQAERGVAETQYKINSQEAAQEFTHLLERDYTWKNVIRNAGENQLYYNEHTGLHEDNTVGGFDKFTGERNKVITNSKQAGVPVSITNPNAIGAAAEKFIGYQAGEQAKKKAMLGYTHEQMRQSADYFKTAVDAEYQLAQTQKDYSMQIDNKRLELETQAAEAIIDSATEVRKMWLNLAQKIEQYTENFDKVVNDLSINMGYTSKQQLYEFKTSMFGVVSDVASKFGKEVEDMAKIQATYAETTGRNKIFGQRDYGNLTALGMYLGDDGLAASYASEMEIFNTGVSDSVDMLNEALQDVNRMGLNGRKYTKTLVENLKLAQKYNFKGGTKGLMEMAKWAENTRFNMNSMSAQLDKISEGGLEGVITQGAQFQVLGGHAAMNADPIAMMFERYADPQALMKRYQDMTIGFGSIDRTTGETTFSGPEQMLMEQIAKVRGVSLEDVMNETRARNKREIVAKQLSGNFTEEQQAFISNNATYDKETGQFKVKVKGENGKYEDTEVSKLTQEDLDKLMPEKHNERMEDFMITIIDLLSKTKGEETREKILVAEATYANTIDKIGQRVAEAMENFNLNYPKYVEEVKAGQEEATKQYKNYFELAKAGNEAVDSKANEIKATASNINAALLDTARIIQEANAKIAAAGGIGYTAPTTGVTNNIPTSIKLTEGDKKAIQQTINRHQENTKIDPHNNLSPSELEEAIFSSQLGERLKGIKLTKGNDFIIGKTNSPMIAHGDNVTKMNDGLVQANPKDVAIFAKEGGVIGQGFADLYNEVHSNNNSPKDMNIHMDGRLELVGQNGQTIDLVSAFNNDPIALRTFARMLFRNEYDSNNGGRGVTSLERNYG